MAPAPAAPRRHPLFARCHARLSQAMERDVAELDVTAAFRATAAAWLAESEAHAVELARLEPPGAFAQRQADRRAMLATIDAELLRHVLLVARRT
jgi:hypothetical protein